MTNSEPERAYGSVGLTPHADVVAASYTTWTFTYTVGQLGMDDGSTLKLATEMHSDWGPPQFDEPEADNYSSVHTSGDATVEATFDPRGYERPWMNTVDVHVSEGTLEAGDTVTLVLGDTTYGSRGVRAQSFAEEGFEFRTLVDVFETGQFVDVPGDTEISIVGGPATSLAAVVPSHADAGSEVAVSIRAEDEWGNVDREFDEDLSVEVDDPDATVPGSVSVSGGTATASVTVRTPGVRRVTVTSEESDLAATTNPVVCGSGESRRTFWGDLHGQSEETVGTGTIREYFSYARETGFLDFAAPANHDFQLSDSFWEEVQAAVNAANAPGEFVTFLGYEWSANTPAGGDHNVYFRDGEGAVQRVSNWMVDDGEDGHTGGVYPIEELYDHFAGRDDVLVIPHQGGRPASLEVLDPDLTPFVEIISLWGVFEWFAHEAMDRGYPVGFVGGSDDTTGRLGTNRPPASDWYNVKGGLMAAQADELSREALWEAFTGRRVYATTGRRILLDVRVDDVPMGGEVEVDAAPEVDVAVHGTAPVQRIDVFRGADRIATRDFADGDGRLEFEWTGLDSKNRDKSVDWSGGLYLNAGRIDAVEAFGFDSPDHGVESTTGTAVHWSGATTGNYQGLRLDVDAPDDAVITFDTDPIRTSMRVDELAGDREFDGGYLNKRLVVRRTGAAAERDVDLSVRDGDAPPGTHPYYARVTQADGEMAWSSPVFVTR